MAVDGGEEGGRAVAAEMAMGAEAEAGMAETAEAGMAELTCTCLLSEPVQVWSCLAAIAHTSA